MIGYRYNILKKVLKAIVILLDDRTFDSSCDKNDHTFSPGSLACSCGKMEFDNMAQLLGKK